MTGRVRRVQELRRSNAAAPRPGKRRAITSSDWERDWWCPSEKRYVMCPGPCPDGTLHT